MTLEKPLYVEFAEKVLGWTSPYQDDDGDWFAYPPRLMKGAFPVPRADLDGYDLIRLIEKNGLKIRQEDEEGEDWIVSKPLRWGSRARSQAASLREAILRCLSALADAGKLVRP